MIFRKRPKATPEPFRDVSVHLLPSYRAGTIVVPYETFLLEASVPITVDPVAVPKADVIGIHLQTDVPLGSDFAEVGTWHLTLVTKGGWFTVVTAECREHHARELARKLLCYLNDKGAGGPEARVTLGGPCPIGIFDPDRPTKAKP